MTRRDLYIILAVVAAILFIMIPKCHSGESPPYIIQNGDTLASIAEKVYHDPLKWRKIWEANPCIKDPNVIYPGQFLALPGIILPQAKQVIPKPWPPKEEFRSASIKLMFKVNELPFLTEIDANVMVLTAIDSMSECFKKYRFTQIRVISNQIGSPLRVLESYKLADALTYIYQRDKEWACMLLAIAWHESHFVNKRGSCGEIGFYQFLPSTVKSLHPMNYKIYLKELEENPDFATRYAWHYVYSLKKEYGTIDRALRAYNGSPIYPGQVIHKYNIIKKTLGV